MPDDPASASASLPTAAQEPFAVVAIGASAGGLDALKELLTGLSDACSGAAYIVVMHRDPNRESALAALLQGMTSMVVQDIQAGDRLQPGVVLMVPPGQIATCQGDALTLAPRGKRPPPTIDLLFQSLAQSLGPRLVGIVLSGNGSDGTEGLLAIQDHGGLTLAQAPEGLAHPGMPSSAIGKEAADQVLTPNGMAQMLARWLEELPPDGEIPATEDDEAAIARIVEALFQITAADFSGYKRVPQERRIRRRQRLTRTRSLSEYADRVQRNRGEAHRLRRDLLIRITQFMRDPSAFGELVESALTSLVKQWEGPSPLRIWVPGCSTGEEAYTLAMLLLEVMREEGFTVPVQIFATDLDPESIRMARRGLYPAQIAAQIPSAWLDHYFVREDDDGYRVSKRVRECVVFSTHDLLRDPPFSRMDLVSCRNLLIYLNSTSQAWVIETFHYALNPEGLLFLGTAESVPTDSPLFEPLGTRARLYRRTDQPTRRLARRVRATVPNQGVRGEVGAQPSSGRGPGGSNRLDMIEATLVLARHFAPPAVLLDQQGEVLYFFEGSQRYFRPQAGPPGYHVLHLILEPLQPPLRCLLHQHRTRISERRSGLESPEPAPLANVRGRPVPEDGDPQNGAWVSLVLQPVQSPVGALLLVFEPAQPPSYDTASPPEPPLMLREEYGVGALQEELSRTQLSLNHAIQELERANAELRLSNEDLLSINEEVQSTNEELETSKEELESVNEELALVNSELREKILELDRVNGDLQNLMASTQIATVFVDGEGQVLQYTPAATSIFRLIPSDRGRPLWDLSHMLSLTDRDLQEMIQRAQTQADEGTPHTPYSQTEVLGAGDRVYMVQAYPYRAISGEVDGAVLNFIDLTEIRTLEAGIRQLATSIDLFPIPFIITDDKWKIVSWNQGARAVFGYDNDEIHGQDYFTLVPVNQRDDERARLDSVRASRTTLAARVPRLRKSGEIFPALNEVGWFEDGGRIFTTIADRDFSERAHMEERTALLVRELDHRVKNTLALVQGLLEYSSLTAGDSMETFIRTFRARLQALATSQRALASGVATGASLRELLFRGVQSLGLGDRVRMEGPLVELPADLAFPLSMAIHELTTNAIRHGALSTEHGEVDIEWQIGADNILTMIWAESGVPSVEPSDQTGLGTRLILEGLPYQTGGTASVQYTEHGIRWTITIPL